MKEPKNCMTYEEQRQWEDREEQYERNIEDAEDERRQLEEDAEVSRRATQKRMAAAREDYSILSENYRLLDEEFTIAKRFISMKGLGIEYEDFASKQHIE